MSSATNTAIDLLHLLDCIQAEESGGRAFPDGAVNIETLPDGSHTIARGRYQILETTWKLHTSWQVEWAHEPGHAKSIALKILLDCQKWYPRGGPARLDFCYSAGVNATPASNKKKWARALRVAEAYNTGRGG